MPSNGSPDGRPQSSTLARRVRLTAFTTASPTATPKSEGAGDPLSALDGPGDNGDSFGRLVERLGPDEELSTRISRLNELSSHFDLYDSQALFAFLDATLDFAGQNAPLAARKAAFSLLQACARLSDLPEDRRRQLITLTTEPVEAFGLEDQLIAVKSLTRDGALVSEDARDFVIETLASQTISVLDARKRALNEAEKTRPRGSFGEKALHILLDLAERSTSSSPQVYSTHNFDVLVKSLLDLAEQTTSKVDMKKAAAALGTVIRAFQLPDSHLARCVEVSCAMLNAIPDLNEYFWDDVLLLLKSKQDAAVQALFSVLSLTSDKHTHAICGALSVLRFVVVNQGENGFPLVPFTTVIQHLMQTRITGRRIRRDCLKCIRLILEQKGTTDVILGSDWRDMTLVLISAFRDSSFPRPESGLSATDPSDYAGLRTSSSSQTLQGSGADEIAEQFDTLLLATRGLWKLLSKEQRSCVAKLHFAYHSPDAHRTLLSQVSKHDLQMPSPHERSQRQFEVVQLFVIGREIDTLAYVDILYALNSSLCCDIGYQSMTASCSLIVSLLEDFENHPKDTRAANTLAEIFTTYWTKRNHSELGRGLALLWPLLQCPTHTVDGSQIIASAENVVTDHLVAAFAQSLTDGAPEAAALYSLLLNIFKAKTISTHQRLRSLDCLSSLRSDISGLVCLSDESGCVISPKKQLACEKTLESIEPLSWGGDGVGKRSGAMVASEWLLVVLEILQRNDDSQVLPYLLMRLPLQLGNPALFTHAIPHVKHLRNVVTSQIRSRTFSNMFIPPDAKVTGKSLDDSSEPLEARRGGADAHAVQILTMLLGYSGHFSANENDDIVRTFYNSLDGSKMVKKASIHALTICCYAIPASTTKSLPAILMKMVQIITQSDLAVDILEFLGGLARLPEIYVNFREDEFRMVFAICVRYLEHSREKRLKLVNPNVASTDYTSNRVSEVSMRSSSTPTHDSGRSIDGHGDLPQYVFALAYHVLTIWFLSLKLTDRSNFVGWITKNLAWTDANGNEHMEEQSQVALDMMHRTAYLDLGETESRTVFSDSDGKVLKKTWLVGLSLCTVETAVRTGLTQLIKRQASGTTYATYQQSTAPLPPHHAPPPTDVLEALRGPEARINIFPNHVFLQLLSNIAPMPVPMEPICLPDDEATKRAIAAFDRMDTVDGYRVGVVYVAEGQFNEAEILSNTEGSLAFEYFLTRLGTKVRLKGARFNTQGLDREADGDGEYTAAWRDRVAEIVFHVPTMMPTDKEHDPQCMHKKKHCGNDFVNIVFNESGLPWRLDTLPSQFNYVNIVISPGSIMRPDGVSTPVDSAVEGDRPFLVQTVSRASFPEISPASSPKLVPLSSLATFVRQLALHCAVFCNVWSNREDGENASSWRSRLREIKKLRDRFVNTGTSASARYPGAKSVRSYATGDPFRGTIEMGGLVDEEGIIMGLDFSRWAGPNPPLS